MLYAEAVAWYACGCLETTITVERYRSFDLSIMNDRSIVS